MSDDILYRLQRAHKMGASSPEKSTTYGEAAAEIESLREQLAVRDHELYIVENNRDEVIKDRNKLREQLVKAERGRDELLLAVTEVPGYTNPGTFKEAVSILVMDCLNAESALAEAQATIEKVREAVKLVPGELDDAPFGRLKRVLDILSAPSSTGGNDDESDDRPGWFLMNGGNDHE